MSHGDPGRRLRPSLRPLISPSATRSLVETHVLFRPGFLQANSHNCLLSVTFSEVKKHETWLYLTHMESLHSPCWQTYEKKFNKINILLLLFFQKIILKLHTWVPWLHSVTLSGLWSGSGHWAALPLQYEASVQSPSLLPTKKI